MRSQRSFQTRASGFVLRRTSIVDEPLSVEGGPSCVACTRCDRSGARFQRAWHDESCPTPSRSVAFCSSPESFGPVSVSAPSAQQPAPGPADQEAARLEIDLVRYKDTSPEAAEVLARLVDLYHANGRVFGLVRTTQKFITVHPADKRHKR